jgi:hypothetical protein
MFIGGGRTADFKEELHKYITGIVKKKGLFPLMECLIIFTSSLD